MRPLPSDAAEPEDVARPTESRRRRLTRPAVAVGLVVIAGLGLLFFQYGPYLFAALDARSRAHQVVDQVQQMGVGDLDAAHMASLHGQVAALRSR